MRSFAHTGGCYFSVHRRPGPGDRRPGASHKIRRGDLKTRRCWGLNLQRVSLLNDLAGYRKFGVASQPEETAEINASKAVEFGLIAALPSGAALDDSCLIGSGGDYIACPSVRVLLGDARRRHRYAKVEVLNTT